MMGNQGVRLNLVFRKEIKGENRRDKRKVCRDRKKGTGRDPGKRKKEEGNQREKRERWDSKLENLEFLK